MAVYEIVVRTGTESGAGTDADVFLRLYGERGISHEVQLGNASDNFEAGAVDRFVREMPDLGNLTAARVYHDNQGWRPGWFLSQIVVTRQSAPVTQWVFPLEDWLAADEPRGTEALLFPVAGDVQDTVETADSEVDLMGNWDSVLKELEVRIGRPQLASAALASSTAAATALLDPAPAPFTGAADARGGTVVRAFWWGFHVQFSHEDLVVILDSADMINATVAAIGGNIPSPAAPWIKLLAPVIAGLHNGLRALDHGNGIYVSMSWFAPGVFVPTTV